MKQTKNGDLIIDKKLALSAIIFISTMLVSAVVFGMNTANEGQHNSKDIQTLVDSTHQLESRVRALETNQGVITTKLENIDKKVDTILIEIKKI